MPLEGRFGRRRIQCRVGRSNLPLAPSRFVEIERLADGVPERRKQGATRLGKPPPPFSHSQMVPSSASHKKCILCVCRPFSQDSSGFFSQMTHSLSGSCKVAGRLSSISVNYQPCLEILREELQYTINWYDD